GRHFPDTDPQHAGADSLDLLRRVVEKITEAGYRVGNIDATVLAQQPKLAPFLPQMRVALAGVCGVAQESVSVKATTEEGMGYTGTEEGIAAHAVVLLEGLAHD
ncbi:MAG: 2-C-methyl-D-erythritol 2,4-cyclodiphosphate synthase, partial [Oscillospiraceae bacterium]|nr:2-C-methyl-D-erythritol 2,4-cyclodiphosphate synthase [Oscillospiraceae bacterium]